MTDLRRAQLDAALAEYGALRDEVMAIRAVQKNVITIAFTAYASVFSAVIATKVDNELLLILAPLGLALYLIQLGEMLMMDRIARYTKKQLWPAVKEASGYQHSWERDRTKGENAVSRLLRAVLADGVFPLMLAGGGYVGLSYAGGSGPQRTAAGVCVFLTVALPMVVGIVYLGREKVPQWKKYQEWRGRRAAARQKMQGQNAEGRAGSEQQGDREK